MSEVTRKQLNYTIACIHEFARRKQLSQQDAFRYLWANQGIAFLMEHYEIEHTLSLTDALDDLELICKKNGGQLS